MSTVKRVVLALAALSPQAEFLRLHDGALALPRHYP
jgi:hypothetical protein